MGTRLNKKTYTKLIEEDIAEIEKHMPKHSLEKQHIIDILRWSIDAHYEGASVLDYTKCKRRIKIMEVSLSAILFESKEPAIKVYAQSALDEAKEVKEKITHNISCKKHDWFGLPDEICPECDYEKKETK